MTMREILTVTLWTETAAKDAVGQVTTTRTPATVRAIRRSITSREFFAAEQAGIRADFVLDIFAGDYAGQTHLTIDGSEYSVYRIYQPRRDLVELYCGEKVGG